MEEETKMGKGKEKEESIYTCDDVKTYLSIVEEIKNTYFSDDSILVFRGEPEEYPSFGKPGVFRGDYLINDAYFERNLLEELKANKLTNGSTYLEIAIDSQHGGFPSRLLDVSYNCLVALYFAVVSAPERKEEEDKKNGRVIVYSIDKAYCPKGRNVINNYDSILNNPNGLLNSSVFSFNHKLIDHIKLNNRIIAQQGALISFQGMEWEPIPEYMYKTIRIPSRKKGDIANQLEKYFGINTSFIYPEIEHAVEKFKNKATNIESMEYSLDSEIEMVFRNMKTLIDYELAKVRDNRSKEKQFEVITALEGKLKLFKQNVENFKKMINNVDNSAERSHYDKYAKTVVEMHNELMEYYNNNPFLQYLDSDIEICGDFLKVK